MAPLCSRLHRIHIPSEQTNKFRNQKEILRPNCKCTYSVVMENTSVGWNIERTPAGNKFPHKMIASLDHGFWFANVFRSLFLRMQFRPSANRNSKQNSQVLGLSRGVSAVEYLLVFLCVINAARNAAFDVSPVENIFGSSPNCK